MKTRINIPRIENMTSPRTGKEVPNQFKIFTDEGVFFQSYSSIIAFKPYGEGKIVLDRDKWDYSRTTSKYRNEFLRETTKQTQAKIDNGEYVLEDLNR